MLQLPEAAAVQAAARCAARSGPTESIVWMATQQLPTSSARATLKGSSC